MSFGSLPVEKRDSHKRHLHFVPGLIPQHTRPHSDSGCSDYSAWYQNVRPI